MLLKYFVLQHSVIKTNIWEALYEASYEALNDHKY